MEILCYDNGGGSFDRYTVAYECRGSWVYLRMSHNPKDPYGVKISGTSPQRIHGSLFGRRVSFWDLPVEVQETVLLDIARSAVSLVREQQLSTLIERRLPMARAS